jgi:hypothetical protein
MKRTALLLLSAFAVQLSARAQGSLTPPGPPAPTMKSLDQVEPRTPVDADHTPGDVNSVFNITQAGSYYLTTNVVGVASKSGIQILASHVVLDLNGFSLFGAGTSLSGILIAGTASNVVVRNGVIHGWPNNNSGIGCSARNVVLERLTVTGSSFGISVVSNTVVRDCTVSGNAQAGIYVSGAGCWILNNQSVGNNTLNVGSIGSIHITGPGNRVEGNQVVANGPTGYGIYVPSSSGTTNNLVIRNSVVGGGANNIIFGTNQLVGPLINITSTSIITNANPWANFAY